MIELPVCEKRKARLDFIYEAREEASKFPQIYAKFLALARKGACGTWARLARQKLSLTQVELSITVGMSQSLVSAIELGDKLNFEFLFKLNELFESFESE